MRIASSLVLAGAALVLVTSSAVQAASSPHGEPRAPVNIVDLAHAPEWRFIDPRNQKTYSERLIARFYHDRVPFVAAVRSPYVKRARSPIELPRSLV